LELESCSKEQYAKKKKVEHLITAKIKIKKIKKTKTLEKIIKKIRKKRTKRDIE
jgi:hypothetical protein